MKGFKTKCLKQVVSLLLSAAMIGTSISASAEVIADTDEVEALGDDDVYTLEAKNCTVYTDKVSITEKAGTDDYFTIVGNKNGDSAAYKCDSNSKTFSDGYEGTYRINLGTGVTKNHVAFTTSKAATLKVWWADNKGNESSLLTVVNAEGTTISYENGTSADPALTTGTAQTHISTIELEDAGEYHVGGATGTNYIYKMEVTEAAATSASESAIKVDFTSIESEKVAADTSGTVTLDDTYTVAGTDGTGSYADREYSVTLKSASLKTSKKGSAIGVEIAQPSTAGTYVSMITFAVDHLSKVVFNTMSTSSTNTSKFLVIKNDADGTVVDEWNGTESVYGSTAIKATYYLEAGTYSFVVPYGAGRGTRVESMNITEIDEMPTAYWLKGSVTSTDSNVTYDNISDVTLKVQPLDAAHEATGSALTAKLTEASGAIASYGVKVTPGKAYKITSNLADYYTVQGDDNAVIVTAEAISLNTQDIVLVPNSKKYTVTFVNGDDKTEKEANALNRYLISAPEVDATTADGKTFSGWYDADGNLFSASDAVSANATYTAKYSFSETTEILGNVAWDPKKTYGDSTGISFRVCETFALHNGSTDVVTIDGVDYPYFVQGTDNGTALAVGDAFPALNSASASVIFTAKESGTVTIYSKATTKTYFWADSTDGGATITNIASAAAIPDKLTFTVEKGHSYCYKASGSKPMIVKIILSAEFESKPLPKHDVTFVDTDGESVAEATRVREEQNVTAPDSITYKGVKAVDGLYTITSGSAVSYYEFEGWKNASGAAITFPVVMGTSDAVFTAVFKNVTPATGTNDDGTTVYKADDIDAKAAAEGLEVKDVQVKNESGATVSFKMVGLEKSYVEAAGQKITPAFDVYRIDGSGVTATATLLVNGVDYKVTYKDNSKVGTATVTVKGAGKYKGDFAVNGGFKIVDAKTYVKEEGLTQGTGVLVAKASGKPVYTGAAVTTGAGIVVTDKTSKATLVEGTDYIISYVNNVNAGSAVATVVGVGKYGGVAKAGFKIAAYTVKGNESKFDVDCNEVTVADVAKNAVIDGIDVTFDGESLVYGKDYTAASKTKNGQAVITVTFRGNFNGKITKTVTATALDVADLIFVAGDLVAGDDIYKAPIAVYNKYGVKVKYTVCQSVADAKAAKAGVGVVITDSTGAVVAKGTKAVKDAVYTYEVYGNGSYTGSDYYVVDASATKTLTKAKLTIASKVYYTGSEVELPTVKYDKANKKGYVITTADKTELKTSNEGDSFEVIYVNNVNPGSAVVILKGIGNYGGMSVATMKINNMSFPKDSVAK